MALKATAVSCLGGAVANGTVEVLHTEEVRGDVSVPPDVR